jgi:tetratricopeptide (TPR) repeat protein
MPADDRIHLAEAEVDLLSKDASEDPAAVLEGAEGAAREAVRIAPLRAYAYEWLGVACMERARAGHAGSLDDGVAAFDRALALGPYGALAMRKYAQYLLLLGRPADGLAMMQRAEALYPRNGSVAWDLSRALAANNRLPEARAKLERARRLWWDERDPERDEVERAWKKLSSAPASAR